MIFIHLKETTPWSECDCVGSGSYDPSESLSAKDEIRAVLGSQYEALERKCRELSAHPNVESIDDVYLMSSGGGIRIAAAYLFRDGAHVPYVHYFDLSMNPITKNNR